MSFKESAVSTGRQFVTELALVFNHDTAIAAMSEFCQQLTPEGLIQLVRERKPLNMANPLLELLYRHRELVKEYPTKSLAIKFIKLMGEARPDLTDALASLNDEGIAWLYQCTQMIRDRVTNPERFMEEMERPETVLVKCDNCNRSIRVLKEDFEHLNKCPFCDIGKEE